MNYGRNIQIGLNKSKGNHKHAEKSHSFMELEVLTPKRSTKEIPVLIPSLVNRECGAKGIILLSMLLMLIHMLILSVVQT